MFLLFGANPLSAYLTLVGNAFFDLRGFGYTLVQATPLILVSLGAFVYLASSYSSAPPNTTAFIVPSQNVRW